MRSWALSVLRDFHPLRLTAEREVLEEAWFGDPKQVAGWLAEDDPMQGSALLADLPPERFSAAVELLAERWPSWSDERSQPGAVALATLAPARAAQIFREALAAGADRLTRLAVLEAAGLVGAKAQSLEEEALARLALGDEPAEPRWLARRLRSTGNLAAPSTLAAATRWLRHGNFDERLAWLAEALNGHAAFFVLALELAQGTSTLDFADLAPLFPTEAPLERWKSLLVGKPEDTLSEVARDLEANAAGYPSAGFAARLLSSLAPRSSFEEKRSLAAFAVACLAHTGELSTPRLGELVTEQLLAMSDLWLPPAPFHRELARAFAGKPRGEVLKATTERVTFDLGIGRPPALSPRLLEALGELEESELAPLFLEALRHDAHSECVHAAAAALVRLGEVVVAEVLRRWDKLDFCQKIYGLQVLGALGGPAVTDFLESRFDELSNEHGELLGAAAMRQLEPRLLAPLAEELDENELWAIQAFLVLATLVDETPPRLEEARVRQAEHRAEQLARRASDHAALEVLELTLRCAACGHRAVYACRQIYWDPERADEPMPADESPCAGCGWITDLLVVPEAWRELEAELARSAESFQGLPSFSLVSTELVVLIDGRSVPYSTDSPLPSNSFAAPWPSTPPPPRPSGASPSS